jgi:hypothetical protein
MFIKIKSNAFVSITPHSSLIKFTPLLVYKIKVCPRTGHEVPEWEKRVDLLFL